MKFGLLKTTVLLLLLLFLNQPVWAVDYCADGNAQGCWRYEEGSGETVADDSQNTNTGTFKGSGEPAWDNSDLPGSFSTWAVDFDASDDRVVVTADTTLDDFVTYSIVAYARAEGAPKSAQGPILDNTSGSDNKKRFYLGPTTSSDRFKINGRVDYSPGTDAQSIASLGTYSLDTWEHHTLTWDSTGDSKIRLYLDGIEVSYATQTAGSGTIDDDTGFDWWMGASAPSAFFAFNGKLDEIAIFDDILSGAEIDDIRTNGLQPSAAERRVILISEREKEENRI